MTMISMETGETIAYAHPDGRQYIARFDEGGWFQWPARAEGWGARKPASENDIDTDRELPSDLATLALRLSGVCDG